VATRDEYPDAFDIDSAILACGAAWRRYPFLHCMTIGRRARFPPNHKPGAAAPRGYITSPILKKREKRKRRKKKVERALGKMGRTRPSDLSIL